MVNKYTTSLTLHFRALSTLHNPIARQKSTTETQLAIT
jgi:hypothetical protein